MLRANKAIEATYLHMPLLPTAVKENGFTKSAGGGNYLNPSKVGEGDKLRFTILGDDSLVGYQCWVDGPWR